MAVYIVTGNLGGGKTLMSVRRIKDKLLSGCRVATNLDLNLNKLISEKTKNVQVLRIPDKPKIRDLEIIGKGTESYDESQNGLLVLDECGTWFNSRNWRDKERQPVNDWFLHARKLGWDVLLIVQHIENLDAQAVRSIAEHLVVCRRTDRLAIPFLSSIYKAIVGSKLPLPKIHIGKVHYGTTRSDLCVDRWVASGAEIYPAYDTKQAFLENYEHGTYSYLSPWHTHGRYRAIRNWRFYMRLTKIYLKKFKIPTAIAVGFLVGTAFALATAYTSLNKHQIPFDNDKSNEEIGTIIDIVEPEPDQVLQILEQYKIVASAAMNDKVIYYLTDLTPDVEQFRKTINSDQLIAMGYEVNPISECALDLVTPDGYTSRVICF